MIDRESKLSIGQQAHLLGISRSSVYYLPKPVSERDRDIMRRLDELHLKHPFMGARMLRDKLHDQGIKIGRKQVKTLMNRMGIEAVYCKPKTSQKTPGHEIYPYLLRGMTINRANQVWALDTTYIPMAKGFAYLTAVVDWASRKVWPPRWRLRWKPVMRWPFWNKRSGSTANRRSSTRPRESIHRQGVCRCGKKSGLPAQYGRSRRLAG